MTLFLGIEDAGRRPSPHIHIPDWRSRWRCKEERKMCLFLVLKKYDITLLCSTH
jgi:hypothetical protein